MDKCAPTREVGGVECQFSPHLRGREFSVYAAHFGEYMSFKILNMTTQQKVGEVGKILANL